MPLADAAVLVEGQQFYVQLHDPDTDEQALTTLAVWCNRFSPIVATDFPDSLLFDLEGVTHLYGDETKLAQHVLKEFHSRGYRPRVAIADTPSAAWAAAHYSTGPSTIVPVMEATSSLFELPIAALRISDTALAKLDRLGIHRISQLAELPRENLPSRIGDQVLDRLDCLTGDKAETICGHKVLPTFEQQWLLDRATDHWETVQHIICVLLERLANQLRCYGHGVVQLKICFDCASSQPVKVNIGLYRPTVDASHLNSLVQMQLETAKISAAVECVTVTADETEPMEQLQQSLLTTENSVDPREVADLVERLSSRLGVDHVVKAIPVDDWQPEKAFCCHPLTQKHDSSLPINSQQHECFSARPLRISFSPEPIDVIALIPDGPPARFHYGGEQKRVVNCWGPERLETAWWRGPCVKRDYYRVETESANRFWIFRQLDDGQWFLHGSFD